MQSWGEKPYHSLDYALKQRFGEKIYKLTLNGGMSCPNRDGKISHGGCIFCSEGGSGEFASCGSLSIPEQIQDAKKRLSGKRPVNRYIAYFQAYTNTYGPLEHLRNIFTAAIEDPEVVVLSIATRPDCLNEEVVTLLGELNQKKPVWVELGLQTANDKTAKYINRCYPTQVYIDAARELNKRNIPFVTHIILGLPNETEEDMVNTVKLAVECKSQGIKLQLLQILSDSPLKEEYLKGNVRPMEEDEYYALLKKLLSLLPEDTVVHRLTGDGSKKTLLAPLWCGDKKRALNKINALLKTF